MSLTEFKTDKGCYKKQGLYKIKAVEELLKNELETIFRSTSALSKPLTSSLPKGKAVLKIPHALSTVKTDQLGRP